MYLSSNNEIVSHFLMHSLKHPFGRRLLAGKLLRGSQNSPVRKNKNFYLKQVGESPKPWLIATLLLI